MEVSVREILKPINRDVVMPLYAVQVSAQWGNGIMRYDYGVYQEREVAEAVCQCIQDKEVFPLIK